MVSHVTCKSDLNHPYLTRALTPPHTTLFRLERDTWSMVDRRRPSTVVYAPPLPNKLGLLLQQYPKSQKPFSVVFPEQTAAAVANYVTPRVISDSQLLLCALMPF